MKQIETERKFLVLSDAFRDQAVQSFRIKQGYIAHDGGNTVRVRIRDAQGFVTIKGPFLNLTSRFEWEKEIPLEDAEALLLLSRGGIIDKTRYIVPVSPAEAVPSETCGRPCPHEWEGPAAERWEGRGAQRRRVSEGTASAGRCFEVDVFHGDNEGLVMAEIELDNPGEPFERPAWLGEEVTGDKRYFNSHLLVHPYKDWK